MTLYRAAMYLFSSQCCSSAHSIGGGVGSSIYSVIEIGSKIEQTLRSATSRPIVDVSEAQICISRTRFLTASIGSGANAARGLHLHRLRLLIDADIKAFTR